MRRCPTCNKSVRGDLMVCPRCGHTLPMPGTQPTAAPKLPKAAQTLTPVVPGAGASAWLWLRSHYQYLGIGVAAVFFILAVALSGYEWARFFHIFWVAIVGVSSRAFKGHKKQENAPPTDYTDKPEGW